MFRREESGTSNYLSNQIVRFLENQRECLRNGEELHRHRFSRIRVVCRAADKTEGKVMSMMLWERAAKICLRRTATISKQQYGFMQRKSTVDVMIALRVLMESYREG